MVASSRLTQGCSKPCPSLLHIEGLTERAMIARLLQLQKAYNRYCAGELEIGTSIWCCVTVELWHQQFRLSQM